MDVIRKTRKISAFIEVEKFAPFPCKKSLFFQLFFTIPFAVFIVLSALFSPIFDALFLSVYPLLRFVFWFFYLVFTAFTSTFSLVFFSLNIKRGGQPQWLPAAKSEDFSSEKAFFRRKRFIKNFRIYFLQTAFRFYRFMNNFSPSESTVISLSGATSLIIISFASIVSTVWSINLLSGLAPKFTS